MKQVRILTISSTLGYLFLYLPIIVLIIYSFNASKLVTVWGGFSLKWYIEVWKDREILEAARLSLKIASISASLSAIIGTLCGVVLSRFSFLGKRFFSSLIMAPLVMPEVLTGFSLILIFIVFRKYLGIPAEDGDLTVILAHSTLCSAYVALLVNSRLHGINQSLEEAAMDLGATPIKTFFVITIPLISPAIISGWLLSFTLSFDDFIIASFTANPGITTLPMLIYSRMRLGVSPEVNVLGSIIMLIVLMFGIIAYIINSRSRR